jgi:hypothetical protein
MAKFTLTPRALFRALVMVAALCGPSLSEQAVAQGPKDTKLDPKQILREINVRYATLRDVPRCITAEYQLITRTAGAPDVTVTGEAVYHQRGNKFRSVSLPATVKVPPYEGRPSRSLISQLRNEWTFDGDKKEMRMLQETNPMLHEDGLSVVTASVVHTSELPIYFPDPRYQDEISPELMSAEWEGRKEIYMGEPVYQIWTPAPAKMHSDGNALIKLWVDPKDLLVVRAEFHLEHDVKDETSSQRQRVYITLSEDLKTTLLRPGSLPDELFTLKLPEGAKDRTQQVNRSVRRTPDANQK